LFIRSHISFSFEGMSKAKSIGFQPDAMEFNALTLVLMKTE
jgi:hypothetical protein